MDWPLARPRFFYVHGKPILFLAGIIGYGITWI